MSRQLSWAKRRRSSGPLSRSSGRTPCATTQGGSRKTLRNLIKTTATYPRASISNVLKGKKGLVTGVANGNSIAYGAARAFHEAGAEIMLTCRRPKTEQYVRPLLCELGNPALLLCDVCDEEQLQAVFEQIGREWGKLDFLLHSITYAPKEDLHGRVVDCSREGFKTAMEISCYSFIRMAKLAEPLMKDGGCLLTMTYYGAEKVIQHYNIIGPVKAALECAVRYRPASSVPKASGFTPSRRGRSRPGPLPASTGSRSCRTRRPDERRYIIASPSMTWELWLSIWSVMQPRP